MKERTQAQIEARANTLAAEKALAELCEKVWKAMGTPAFAELYAASQIARENVERAWDEEDDAWGGRHQMFVSSAN